MPIKIKLLTDGREKEWDDFIKNQKEARFSFLAGYKKVVKNAFDFAPKYFIWEKYNKIQGILPCFFINGELVSIPFGIYGGLLTDVLEEKEISLGLTSIKKEFPKILITGVKNDILAKNFQGQFLHYCSFLRLEKEETMWRKFNYAARKNIKKARDFEIEIFQDNSKEAIKKWFYPLYLKEMKGFGTPPHRLKFFLNFNEFLGQELKILFAKTKDGKITASLFGVGCFDKNFYIYSNPSLEKYRFQRPNDLLHWEMIKNAYQDGYSCFDFGPMKYEGQKKFKEKWATEKIEYWQYSCGITKSTGRYFQKFFSFGWRYLMPEFLAVKIGPWVRKFLAR